ncbi:unnamed protein product [Closterium sp. Yama58-4]|nr:unnamed protein product [Closterium sp. Yama58-4]
MVFDAGVEDHMSIDADGRGFYIFEDDSGSTPARVRSSSRYPTGTTFSGDVMIPSGATSGIVSSFYLSSLEGSTTQDEIDFEWLGKNNMQVQTNYYVNGVGGHELVVDLGFDASQSFHTYAITYDEDKIQWFIDGELVRTVLKSTSSSFPSMNVYLYSSLWNASFINGGSWAGVNSDPTNAAYTIAAKNINIQ